MSSGIGLKIESRSEVVGKIKKDAELVAESIHRILNTAPYERPREAVGSRIREVLFDPSDFKTATLGSFYVADALNKYETRAEIVQVITTTNSNLLTIQVIFRMLNDPGTTFSTTAII